MDKVVQTCWDGYERYQLVIAGEAGLVLVLPVANRSMPQGGMEDVCRVVVFRPLVTQGVVNLVCERHIF